MMLIGIKFSLRDREVDAIYHDELGLPTYTPAPEPVEDPEPGDPEPGDPVADPIPTYHDYCLQHGYWRYIADVNEGGTDYSCYWTMRHGLMAEGGFGRDLYTRCFNTTAPSAIVMTGQDYRAQYDAGFVEPVGAESLYPVFSSLSTNGQTAGNRYYELLPADVATVCSLSPNRTWAWVYSKETNGKRLGASSRMSTQDYSSVVVQQKQIPSGRDNCALRLMEALILNEVPNTTMANVEEARVLVRASGFDIEEPLP